LALGGIDDLSITNVTATEIKSAYGRVSATAKKKCLQLYTYGVCKCFELILFQEEQIFKKSLAYVSGIKYPVLPENLDDEKVVEKYEKGKFNYERKLQKAVDEVLETGDIPDGVVGLAPDGDRTVLWRWMGPVYEDTAQDKLNQSIFTRNLQELGVDSIEALKYLFPSKTDDEIAGMLSGFPFRMVYRTLESLQKEVTYAGRYRSADPIGTPSIPDPADQLRGSRGSSGSVSGSSTDSRNNTAMGGDKPLGGGTSSSSASADGDTSSVIQPYSVKLPRVPGSPTTGQSLQGGVQQGGRTPEFSSPVPVPGSTIDTDTSSRSSQLRFPTNDPISQPGSADLYAWDQQQPGLLQRLFPNVYGSDSRPTKGKRSK
jgi:hypothetical protein